jgi:hypothetical protein
MRVCGTSCDKCAADIPGQETSYDVRGFDLKFYKGRDFGIDGRDVEEWRVEDLCDSCVSDLKQLLAATGFRITETDQI